MKVKNMLTNQGNKIPNQFLIADDFGNMYFQSYDSIIAVKTIDGGILLDKNYWNWSKTTSRYRNLFLGEDTDATQKKINTGRYKLVNLNKDIVISDFYEDKDSIESNEYKVKPDPKLDRYDPDQQSIDWDQVNWVNDPGNI